VLPLPAADDDLETTSGGLGIEALAGAHILLVEDNAVNMMIGVAMLEQWGVVVEQAVDGRQAIDAVERAVARGRPFDLVLMDVHMPVMSGNQATAQLRQRYRKDQLPIVALTAAALVSEREQALAAGMNEFVTKPIDPSRLRATLTRVINASQAA
jgi:CheY-like chemotaxis protein